MSAKHKKKNSESPLKKAFKKEEEVYDKLNNQLTQEDKVSKSDFIITNNGEDILDSLSDLTSQVLVINEHINTYQVISSGIKKY